MDLSNSSNQPFTRWISLSRSGNGQQNVSQTVQNDKSADESFSTLVASSIKVEIEEPIVPSKRKRKAAMVKTESADDKFSALVAGSTKMRKKEDKPKEKQQEQSSWPEHFTHKNFTKECIELAEAVVGLKLKRYREVVSPGKVRFSVEFGFGVNNLIYLVFESDGSTDVNDADLVEYFVDDEDSIAEVAHSLKKLFKRQMHQSLLLAVGEYGEMKELRRETLERLRAKFSPLLTVETAKMGCCTVEVLPYFKAKWELVYRDRFDGIDNAFSFSGPPEDTPLVDSLKEISRLTNSQKMKAEEIEKSWEKIMTEVKDLYEQQ